MRRKTRAQASHRGSPNKRTQPVPVLARPGAVPPSVVFVTAHDDRAVDAYEVGAVDYLLKPIRSERLAASIDRILANRAANVAEPQPEQLGCAARNSARASRHADER